MNGLRKTPGLHGKVRVHFVIAADGSVSKAEAAHGSDMPDADVTSCIVRGFSYSRFPSPRSGTVDVVFPIIFGTGN